MPTAWFDEIFDDRGHVRPPYANLQARAGLNLLAPDAALAESLRTRPLGDDTRILAVPLVLDDREFADVVQAGVAQRALALQRLFAALVFGADDDLAAVGLNAGGADDLLAMHATTRDALRAMWSGADRDEIRFVYGPDLVRDPDGCWTVLEDNVGCVGGTADSFFATARYRRAVGLGDPGEPDLARAVRQLLRALGLGVDDGVVAPAGCDTTPAGWIGLALEESRRRQSILAELGITAGSAEPAVVLNFDEPRTWNGETALLNAPGTNVLGNKTLLARLRLTDPVLRTPTTVLLDDGDLPAVNDDWVVKTATGRQGAEVFVLRWLSADQIQAVAERVRSEWRGAAVAQLYVEPSRLVPSGPRGWDGFRLEIRPLAYVLGWGQVYVSEAPLGKAVSVYDARRLGNVMQGACYLPVLREPGEDLH